MAVYYGGENYWAESDKVWLQDRSFEAVDVAPGQAVVRPAGSPWRFTGSAGIADFSGEKTRAFTVPEAGGEQPSDGRSVGFQFTVGDEPIYVYRLGRQSLDGSRPSGRVSIYKANGETAGPGQLSIRFEDRWFRDRRKDFTKGEWLFNHTINYGWASSDSKRPAVYRLEPRTSYVLLTSTSAGESIPAPVRVVAAEGITIDGPVTANTGDIDARRPLDADLVKVAAPGTAYPLADFLFSQGIQVAGAGAIAPPDPRGGPNIHSIEEDPKHNTPRPAMRGSQTLFIAGRGSVSQAISVDRPGEYVLVMTGASQFGRDNDLRIRIGDHVVWDNLSLGAGRKPENTYNTYGTRYVQLEPGTYDVTIEGLSDDPRDVAYIDAVHIGTMDAYFGGPDATNFMGSGAATGQTDSKFDVATLHASAMAQNWGLVATTYEGGNSVGGDWNVGGVLFWSQSKWWHPTTKVADLNAASRWFAYGGFQFFQYYPPFEWSDWPHAEDYVQWQASRQRASQWDWEPTYGIEAPVTLTPRDRHYTGSIGSTWSGYWNPITSDDWQEAPSDLSRGMWKCWRILVKAPGTYRLAASLSGDGAAELILDGRVLKTGHGAIDGSGWLTKGIHTVKIRSQQGKVTVTSVSVDR